MDLTNFGMGMEKSTYFLVTLLSLAIGALRADECVYKGELTASYGEIAALKKQTKGLDAVTGDTHRLTTLEQQMDEVYTSTARDTFGAKAAAARPQLDSYRLYVSADALFWKAFEGGKDYASITNSLTVPMKGKSKWVDFDWMWGFRTKVGYRTAHDNWDLVGRYTWFFDKGDSDPNLAGKFATPLFYAPGSTNGSSIKGNARLHLQEGDLSLQKSYFLSRHFSLTWAAALRSSWINQHTENYSYAPGGTPAPMLQQKGESDFWGIGPMLSVGPRWFIDRNWNFFGNFSGSLLYGEFDVKIRTDQNGITPPKNFKVDSHQVMPTVLGSLGMGWETNFLCNRYHIAINLAYEAQYWWRQNQFLSYRPASSALLVLRRLSEDLGFHGLTINALFDF